MAGAIAEWSMILLDSKFASDIALQDLISLASQAELPDSSGQVNKLLNLMKISKLRQKSVASILGNVKYYAKEKGLPIGKPCIV